MSTVAAVVGGVVVGTVLGVALLYLTAGRLGDDFGAGY